MTKYVQMIQNMTNFMNKFSDLNTKICNDFFQDENAAQQAQVKTALICNEGRLQLINFMFDLFLHRSS